MTWDLLGHTWAEDLLRRHIATGELRHAYLFTGAPGIGRRSLALEFARAINCTQPPAPGDFCGVCRVCTQTARMQQPDLGIIAAESEGAMIKVDQVRALQRSLSLTPYEARYRIALLLNFQAANANAQNALLKTLEEAPRSVILLLTADAPENLLPTIASRCEILRLRPAPVDVLAEALCTRWQLEPERARLLASLSNGRTGLALQMAADPSLLEKRAARMEDFLRLLPLNRRERFAAVDGLAKNRDTLRFTLQAWLSLARDLLLCANGTPQALTNRDYEPELHAAAASLGCDEALALVTALVDSLDMLEQNANLRLLADNLVLQLPHLK
jgi:DNA polymerase-3 subunit delta'